MPPFEKAQAPEKNWWGRNWKWVAPVGCVTPIVVCGGGIGVLMWLAMSRLKNSTPYVDSLAAATQNAQVIAALGTPIEAGLTVQGSIKVSDMGGHAHMRIPISGPNGSGKIHIVATNTTGQWNYSRMGVAIDGTSQRIDLQAQAPDPNREPASPSPP